MSDAFKLGDYWFWTENRNMVFKMDFRGEIMSSRICAAKTTAENFSVKLFIPHTVYCVCMLSVTRHTAGMIDSYVRMERSNIYLPSKPILA